MLVETDFCYPSGKGTSMFSRRGAQTISFHLCFRGSKLSKYKEIMSEKKYPLNTIKFRSMREIKDYLDESYHTYNHQPPDKQDNPQTSKRDSARSQSKSSQRSNKSQESQYRDSYLNKTEGISLTKYTPSYKQIYKCPQAYKIRSPSIQHHDDESQQKEQQRKLLMMQTHQQVPSIKASPQKVPPRLQKRNRMFKLKLLTKDQQELKNSASNTRTICNKQPNDENQKEFSFRSGQANGAQIPLAMQALMKVTHHFEQPIVKKKKQQHQKNTLSTIHDYGTFDPYEMNQSTLDVTINNNKLEGSRAKNSKNPSRNSILHYQQNASHRSNSPNFPFYTNTIQDQPFGISEEGFDRKSRTLYHTNNRNPYQVQKSGSTTFCSDRSFLTHHSQQSQRQRSMVDMDRQAGRSQLSVRSGQIESKISKLSKLRDNQLIAIDKNVKRFSSTQLKGSQTLMGEKQQQKQKTKLFKLLGMTMNNIKIE